MKKHTKCLLALAITLLCLILPGFYNALKVVPYRLNASGIVQPIRIALVTDLHSCDYGENMRDLLEALDAQTPDLVLLGGDIFDDELPNDNTIAFLQGISGRYPSYYVTGNHEYLGGNDRFARQMEALKQQRIIRLSGEMASTTLKGSRIHICGVDDEFAWRPENHYTDHPEGSFLEQIAHVGSIPKDGAYNILLIHRPEYLDVYSQYGFDLVLSGHTHGGLWRIPGLLNGLYDNSFYEKSPNRGLFPGMAGGLYKQDNTTLIVSRGLARESTRIPRIYNRPELVIIDLMPE